MNTSFVMTILGRDQPGIVDSIAKVVATHGGNWEESRMARLSDRFAGFIRISVSQSAASELEASLIALACASLDVQVDRTTDDASAMDLSRVRLELVGNDRPGILREITSALAAKRVNVIRLETHCASAPMSGEMLFHAEADLLCPAELKFESLRESIERLGHDMMVEVSVAEPIA